MRPFNCVGIGETRALGDQEVLSGNVKLAMSHVVPDLARGIVTAMEHPDALNEAFEHDVQRRVPSTEMAKQVLAFETATPLEEMLDEVIPWIAEAVANGTL